MGCSLPWASWGLDGGWGKFLCSVRDIEAGAGRDTPAYMPSVQQQAFLAAQVHLVRFAALWIQLRKGVSPRIASERRIILSSHMQSPSNRNCLRKTKVCEAIFVTLMLAAPDHIFQLPDDTPWQLKASSPTLRPPPLRSSPQRLCHFGVVTVQVGGNCNHWSGAQYLRCQVYGFP